MSTLPVYFIRHNWYENNRTKIIDELYGKREIAIHFENKGLDLDEYIEKGAKSALNNLINASQTDCIIVAAYKNKANILMGKPNKAGITIETRFSDDGKEQIELKIIQLEASSYEVKPEDMPLLSVLQPPFATMVQWHMGEIAVNSYYEYLESGQSQGAKPVRWELLSAWHWEILCEEWLRIKNELKFKLFKTGKSMKHLDIIGKSFNGKLVLAQVKRESTEAQFKDFRMYCSGSSLDGNSIYYFTSRDSISKFKTKVPNGINLVSLNDVYDDMIKKDPDFIRSLIYS